MDFQSDEHITSTHAIGDDNTDNDQELPQLATPVSLEHAVFRAHFEIITAAAMENLYNRITMNINKMIALAVEKATSPLHNRIVSLSTHIAQLQLQVLTYQDGIQGIRKIPAVVPILSKKDPRKKKEKQPANQTNINTNGNTNPTYATVAATPAGETATVGGTTGKEWTTFKAGGKKKATVRKLITTIYPQTE
jgi:hypothetical protein